MKLFLSFYKIYQHHLQNNFLKSFNVQVKLIEIMEVYHMFDKTHGYVSNRRRDKNNNLLGEMSIFSSLKEELEFFILLLS